MRPTATTSEEVGEGGGDWLGVASQPSIRQLDGISPAPSTEPLFLMLVLCNVPGLSPSPILTEVV